MIIAPQAEPGGAARSGLKFFFFLSARAYGGNIFVASTQAEPGALCALGSSFFALTPAHMAGIFSLHLPRLSLEVLCALGSSFFCLNTRACGGLFTAASQTGPKAAPA